MRMRKKIIINLSVTILIVTLIILSVFYSNIKQYKIKLEGSSMQILVNNIIKNIDSNIIQTENIEELFMKDYLNRAKFASFLLGKTDENNLSESKWKEIIDLVEVNDVFEVNSNGVITKSRDEDILGINLYENNNLKEFIPLIEGKESKGYYIKFDAISVLSKKNMVYLGVKKPQNSGMILLEIDPVILKNYKKLSSIKDFFSTVTTRNSEILFAIDKETEELIGISKNNKQKIKIENPVESFEKAIDNPTILEVNGVKQLAVAKEYDGNLIGYLLEISVIDNNLKSELATLFISIIFLLSATIIVLYSTLDNLVLNDISRMNHTANLFVQGNKDVIFEKGKTSELTELSKQLNKVIQVIDIKSERISSVASAMGEGFEAYEYYADLNQIFISKNLLNMLGVDATEEDCHEVIREYFNKMSAKLKPGDDSFEEQEIVTTSSGKTLKIRRTILKNSMFAFLEDITKERQDSEKLASELKKEKENTYIDDLTGLYNRKKIKEYITSKIIENNLLKGSIILLDLDNFKKVNDELGHLEGDTLLKIFSDLLRNNFKDATVISRLGGDEFMIFIPTIITENDLKTRLDSFINKLRKILHKYYIRQKLSVSIGVVFLDESFNTFEEIYKCVDSAMYVAKLQGKDCFYFNKEKNTCMGSVCQNCKEYCEKRKLLFGDDKIID